MSLINFKQDSGSRRGDSVGDVLSNSVNDIDGVEIIGESDAFDRELDKLCNDVELGFKAFKSELGDFESDTISGRNLDSGVSSQSRISSASDVSSEHGQSDLGSTELVRLDSCCESHVRVDMDTIKPFSAKRAYISVGYFHNFLGKVRKEADRYNIDLNNSRSYRDFKSIYLDRLDMDSGYVFYFRTVAGLYAVVSSLNRLMMKIVDEVDALRRDSFRRF